MPQPGLFVDDALPPGFAYRAEFLSRQEERDLLREVQRLTFSAVEMRGVVARRRTAHFGWTYGFYARRAAPGPEIPDFLRSYAERIAAWASIEPDAFAEVLVTEYPEGAPIGWHRDAPAFGDVIGGVSLGGAARMKFRPYVSPTAQAGAPQRRHATHEIELSPRSAYLISGSARRDYEHSIPPVATTRYSITYRTLRAGTSTKKKAGA
jgi:alkylated DNA repair dioxygenase AlkB